MTKHLTRKELVAAAREYSAGKTPEHIGECSECREYLLMLVRFHVAGNLPLTEPPAAWVERANELAISTAPASRVRKLLAKLAFDSWAQPVPVGVRGGETTEQRRVRFEIDPVIVDLRAEHQKAGWSFVAQVSGVASEIAQLSADKQILSLDKYGMCQWSGIKPPKKLAITTDVLTVELPEIPWNARKSKRPRKDS